VKLLVLDTSGAVAVVGVVDGDTVLAEDICTEMRTHAEWIADATVAVLARAKLTVGDVDAIVVGRGPGSFIGVRSGIAFAKGLSLASGKPLHGVSTLRAAGIAAKCIVSDVASASVVVDAKRGEVFIAELSGRVIARACRADDVGSWGIPPSVAVCVALGAVDTARVAHTVVRVAHVTALSLAQAHATATARNSELDTLVPEYVRDADAKLPPAVTP
jgi:tRNA threonylcarbamoyl adenosine modification protein YeaZ